MAVLFERVLEMSVNGAVAILVVLLGRLLLRKAPKKYSYALWAVVAFRLVCPVSFRSAFSIFRLTRVVERTEGGWIDPLMQVNPIVPDPAGTMPSAAVTVPPTVSVTPPAVAEPAVTRVVSAMDLAAVVWLVGLLALLIYGVVSYLLLYRRMANAVLLEDNVYQSERVRSPFIMGFIRAKIYLPYHLTGEQQSYVLAHERYHLKRLDHLMRLASFLILVIHWFNPLVWLAHECMVGDMEMSCDEKVLSGADNIHREYSQTLLSFAANRRFPSPGPLAFGESGVKRRISNALRWKKPGLWLTVLAVVVCAAVIVGCAADPREEIPAGTGGEEVQILTVKDGYYRSVECVYMSPLSSYLPITGNSGYHYLLQKDTLTLIVNGNRPTVENAVGYAYTHPAEGEWEKLTEDGWRELECGALAFTDLWESLKNYDAPMIRRYEGGYFLLALDGELQVGKGHRHPDGSGYIWDLYRLEEMEGGLPGTSVEFPASGAASPRVCSLLMEQWRLLAKGVDAIRINRVEEIPTGTVGNTAGSYIYRVDYQTALWNADTRQMTWQDGRWSYLVEYYDCLTETSRFLGMLTEDELQTRFGTADMEKKYGGDDLWMYRAAAMELWK